MPTALFPVTRRQFSRSLCGLPLTRLWGAEPAPGPWDEPAKVHRVYVVAPTVHWPKPDLNVKRDVAEVEARMAEVARKHSRLVAFTGGDVLQTDAEVEPFLKRMGDVDAVLIFPMSAPAGPLNALVQALPVPALYFSRPYAGHSWSAIPAFRKSGRRIDAVASSSFDSIDPYVPVFRTIRHMKRSKVLVGAREPRGREQVAQAFRNHYGTAFEFFTYKDLEAAYQAADARKAELAAGDLKRGALRVVEPKPEEITGAARLYLAISEMLRQAKANAMTIDCFGGLLAKQLPAYPCVAWSKLNDAGYYGVCEGDLPSTMTQILLTSFSGMPGFVSDPVFDVSRDEVIHAHCVAATRMRGLQGPSSPYILRNHLETAEGVVMQVLMPYGDTITVARYDGPDKMLASTAEVTGNVDSDRGCRTQIRTRVPNAHKWLESYGAGLHRVIFYGDHMSALGRMGRMMGFQVHREV